MVFNRFRTSTAEKTYDSMLFFIGAFRKGAAILNYYFGSVSLVCSMMPRVGLSLKRWLMYYQHTEQWSRKSNVYYFFEVFI
jgi:hypothetical protein